MGFEKQPVEVSPKREVGIETPPEIMVEEKKEEPVTIQEVWRFRGETVEQMHFKVDRSLRRIVGDIVELVDKIADDERALAKQNDVILKNRKDVSQAMEEALSATDNEKVKEALLALRQNLDAEHQSFREELDDASLVNESTGWFRGKEKEKINEKLNTISRGGDEIIRLKEKLPDLQSRVDAEKIYIVAGEEPKGETEHLIKMADDIKKELARMYQPIAEAVEKLSPKEKKQFSGDFKVDVMSEFNEVYRNFVAQAEAALEKKQEELRKKDTNDVFDNRKVGNFRQIAEHVLFR